MRQIYLRLLLILTITILFTAVTRLLVIRPIACLPNCRGEVLNNRNLQGYDLSAAVMVESDLDGSDLRNADLTGGDFSGANLSGVNLSNTDLTNARFVGANLSGADLRNAVLNNTDFTGANLTGANLTRTDMTGAVLNGALLNDARLVEVNLQGVNLAGSAMNNADLTGARLDAITLSGSAISSADLSGATLSNADLNGSWLNLANLSGADLTGASLAGTSMIGANLSSAQLANSNMVGATMVGADFSGAILLGTNLTGTRLFQFELNERDLSEDPILAELNELQISQIAVNATLNGVRFDETTLWPSGKTALLFAILGSDFAESQFEALAQAAIEAAEPTATATDSDAEVINPADIRGDIIAVGSSDVLSITQLMSQQFTDQGYRDSIEFLPVDMQAAFEQFCQPDNEIDILNASRAIQEDELAICATIGLAPVRFRIGTDAAAVIVNPSNEFVEDVTTEELAKLFTAERWNDVNPDWPAQPIVRYIPTGDSASRSILLRTVFGVRNDSPESSRILFEAPGTLPADTTDLQILGVARDPYAVSIVPFEAYENNADILSLLAINGAELNEETVENGDYLLARPLLIYADPVVLREKPQVTAFLDFYLSQVRSIQDLLSYFIGSEIVLSQARTALEEASVVVPTAAATTADTSTADERDALAELFTIPSPLIPLAPISPQLEVDITTTLLDETTLEDLADSFSMVGGSSVLSPTDLIREGFQGLGYTGTITLTTVATNQAFESLCESDQVDLIGVSRTIQDDETTRCAEFGRTPVAFQVGTDVIVVVINPNNDFVADLTLEQVAQLFTARRWSDINPAWPNEPIQRFIPPTESDVFDLFVERVFNDEADQLLLAPNLIPVEDRGKQAQGISINPYAVGFMEFTAYQRNAGLLTLVSINEIVPSDATIDDGTYALSRPLLLYTDQNVLETKPAVAAFLNFYLTNVQTALEPFNSVPANSQALDTARNTLRQAVNPPQPTATPTLTATVTPTPLP